MFHESIEDKLHPVNIRVSERRRWNNNEWDMDWDDDNYFDWKSNVEYVMTEREKLVEADKQIENNSKDDYEYKSTATDSLRKQIEEKERQLERDKQKLEEAEKRQTTLKKIGQKKKTETAQTQLPAFSFLI